MGHPKAWTRAAIEGMRETSRAVSAELARAVSAGSRRCRHRDGGRLSLVAAVAARTAVGCRCWRPDCLCRRLRAVSAVAYGQSRPSPPAVNMRTREGAQALVVCVACVGSLLGRLLNLVVCCRFHCLYPGLRGVRRQPPRTLLSPPRRSFAALSPATRGRPARWLCPTAAATVCKTRIASRHCPPPWLCSRAAVMQDSSDLCSFSPMAQ